jgi:5-formyltetrahydrofolate cyclo-ligase
MGTPSEGDERARERLLSLPALRSARTVALYAALEGEVALDLLAEQLTRLGATLVYPRVTSGGLELLRVPHPSLLRPGFRGVREPPPGAPRVAVVEVDSFVVPGLLFDRRGVRLGRGGGHYDRLLAAAGGRASRIGLCYAERVVERLPEDLWDQRMHWVVTDRELIPTGKAP